MSVIASLVVGSDGASSIHGSSQGLSTDEDRKRFLHLHRMADAIVIGRMTAESEPYKNAHCPVYVVTKNSELELDSHFTRLVVKENSELVRSFDDLKRKYRTLVIESGYSLLRTCITLDLVDELWLSITPLKGDSGFINAEDLLTKFTIEEDQTINGTRLLKCRYQRNSTNS